MPGLNLINTPVGDHKKMRRGARQQQLEAALEKIAVEVDRIAEMQTHAPDHPDLREREQVAFVELSHLETRFHEPPKRIQRKIDAMHETLGVREQRGPSKQMDRASARGRERPAEPSSPPDQVPLKKTELTEAELEECGIRIMVLDTADRSGWIQEYLHPDAGIEEIKSAARIAAREAYHEEPNATDADYRKWIVRAEDANGRELLAKPLLSLYQTQPKKQGGPHIPDPQLPLSHSPRPRGRER